MRSSVPCALPPMVEKWTKESASVSPSDIHNNNFLCHSERRNIEMLARNHTYLFSFSTVHDFSFCNVSLLIGYAAVAAWQSIARSHSFECSWTSMWIWKTQPEFVCLARRIRAQVLITYCWFGRCQESTDELSALVEMFVFASSLNVALLLQPIRFIHWIFIRKFYSVWVISLFCVLVRELEEKYSCFCFANNFFLEPIQLALDGISVPYFSNLFCKFNAAQLVNVW